MMDKLDMGDKSLEIHLSIVIFRYVFKAMVEGTRVECIIGATRIRDFSTATEVDKRHRVVSCESRTLCAPGTASQGHDLRESDCRGTL